MPHRKWLFSTNDVNLGTEWSQDYSGYLPNLTPDIDDASQQFGSSLSFPWSCEGDNCNCASIDTMSVRQPSISTNPLPSTTESFLSAEENPYFKDPHPPPASTTTIAVQQIREGICPLATGATKECVPQLCGANAPCTAFWSVPEIEECGDVACLIKPEDQYSQSLREPSSPQRQNSPSPAKKSRRDSGQTQLSRSCRSPSDHRRPIITQSDTNDTLKHDKDSKPKPTDSKQAHSVVEKRYRENLNAKISELHDVLSSTPDATSAAETCQMRKSEVLQMAIDYVNQSQLEIRHMTNDINRLNTRAKRLEKLVKCEGCNLFKGLDGLSVLERRGPSGMNGVGAPYGVAATYAG